MSEVQTVGVKETTELLEGVKVIGVAGVKILADKKLNLLDLGHVMELAKQSETLVAAFDGLGEIPKEVKDLSLEESQAIVSKVFEVIAAIKAAKQA